MGQPHGIGIVGLGVISAQYLETLGAHPGVRIAATADLDTARAAAVAERFDGCRALTVDELVADPSVQTVLNLTIPAAHAEVALAALRHGKNVFGEKPLAPAMAEARRSCRPLPRPHGRAVHPTPCSAPGSRPPARPWTRA
ncbi:hypothetical protein GCM10025863_28870 [Microbacterium suwonense]|uniref:Gfo/Idh/MocA-like oxidoreductase N-terminal domain-containing protein n=1 Tax=Microbacterium suwonense TaxID=683047 RepID=A0ABN6X653_9MICO|nr:hypothetical protein GCM10025863_28870 [Microbacterium suwonense]